jgi:fimbrial isopeptide formation D2 family protein/LPXTG-motif cell wall-anchored protein
MKKIISLVLALAMVMMVGISFAETTVSYDRTVSVTGLANGDVANFYKVLEWVNDAEGNVKGWRAVSPFSSVLTTPELTKVLVGNPEATPAVAPTGITAELAQSLAALEGKTLATSVTVGTNGIASYSVPTDTNGAGLYMALIVAANTDVVYNPVFISSDYKTASQGNTNTWGVDETASYSNSAAAKKSTTSLNKTASTTELSPDDMKWQTTAIGDTVNFTVTTTIPGFGTAFVNPYFKMTDKLTDLKLSGTPTITSPANAVATITPAEDGKSYTILFDSAYLKTLAVPTEVTVTYSAIVTNTAPLHVNREKNEVWTEYSHNILDEEDHAFKKDTTQHYTFTLDADTVGYGGSGHGEKTSEIVKVGRKSNGDPITQTTETSEITSTSTWQSPLADAHFKLYRDKDCTVEYIPKTTTGANGTALDIVSGADGRMTIAGLDAGEYWLREESAPDGFVKDSHVAHIVITAVTSSKDVTEYTKDGVTWLTAAEYNALGDKTGYKSYTYATETLDSYTVTIDGQEAASYTFQNKGNEVEIDWTVHPPVEMPHQFTNTEGIELPSTGGIGTTIFYILGGLLVVGAAVILVARRKAQD